jgi:hypothetical protein
MAKRRKKSGGTPLYKDELVVKPVLLLGAVVGLVIVSEMLRNAAAGAGSSLNLLPGSAS